MIWFDDRVSLDIAASQATEHSGLARSKNKFALRVRASVVSQVAAEVKAGNSMSGHIQVLFLFKVQPIPLGLRQDQIVEWASKLAWPVRIIKKLGKDAFLLGSNQQPPHQHLQLNGTVVLIKQVSQKAPAQNSALVAGPRQVPMKSSKDSSTSSVIGQPDP